MKIKMKKDWKFSENGHSYRNFEKGHEYDVSPSCGESAVDENVASLVETKMRPDPDNKNQGNAPENK